MIVLNVGGGESRHLPSHFNGWKQLLLDIDPAVKPDIVYDALDMQELTGGEYDAVYCSHNLEHFYAHDVPKVLAGFLHVLKPGGFAEINVPNIRSLMQQMIGNNLDVNDVWYRAPGDTPITFHDVLYGWSKQMRNGNLYYAHKCAFTPFSLCQTLCSAGFEKVGITDQGCNLVGVGFKCH